MQVHSYNSNQKENITYNVSNTIKGFLGKNKAEEDVLLKKEPLVKSHYAGLNF
jgi:protein phosphatase PTC2/3